ncbi:MAG: DEAD/DEAH box helicase [Rickettsiales bacterium]|nr:DEAD/DEAH box helicase [Rickettsiales bacterium]
MTHFDDFGLPEALTHTLKHMQFDTPTPIQAKAIPHALAGKDVLGSAQTGTGKTAAFGIPLIARLLSNPRGSALVMTPTRELAAQVMQQLQAMLGRNSKIKTALLIGGESMPKQIHQLRKSPRVYVGTPGRINDHLERGTLKLNDTTFLVLDETDRMLDMGFTIQIEQIMKHMPQMRQTMLFSATLPKNIEKVAAKYMQKPVRISVSNTSAPAANIKHDAVQLENADKYDRLLSELNEREGSVILFMKTKHATDKMATKLSKAGHSADAIHGNLRQNKRDRVIANFRRQKYRILVATDVAARGLDIPHIEHVINYDLPQCAEDYIHRIGRTARAGAEGSAICFVAPSDTGKWRAIQRLMDPNAVGEQDNHSDDAKPKGRNRKFSGKPRRRIQPGKPRFAKRNEQRGEQSSEPRHEKRDDKRGEKKSFAKKGEFRNEKRSESRSESKGERRNEQRGERRTEQKGERKARPNAKPRNPNNRSDKPSEARRTDKPRKPGKPSKGFNPRRGAGKPRVKSAGTKPFKGRGRKAA